MIVNRNAGHPPIGCITSAGSADLTTPESLHCLQQLLTALPEMTEELGFSTPFDEILNL